MYLRPLLLAAAFVGTAAIRPALRGLDMHFFAEGVSTIGYDGLLGPQHVALHHLLLRKTGGKGELFIAQMLSEHGTPLEVQDEEGLTPLASAVWHHNDALRGSVSALGVRLASFWARSPLSTRSYFPGDPLPRGCEATCTIVQQGAKTQRVEQEVFVAWEVLVWSQLCVWPLELVMRTHPRSVCAPLSWGYGLIHALCVAP